MTVRELYEQIGGNYEQAAKILKMDKLIDRYVRKFNDSDLLEKLQAADESMDAAAIFESTHAIKGVCGNLGFDRVAEAASVLADEFRPGSARQYSDEQAREMLRQLETLYRRTLEGIRAYMNAQ